MLLSAVSVLVVAQSSSEIPEGLMNNPVLSLQLQNSVHCTQFTPRNRPALCTKISHVTHISIENTGCTLNSFLAFKIKMNFVAF